MNSTKTRCRRQARKDKECIMDPELQALREARLAELKRGTAENNSPDGNNNGGSSSTSIIGSAIAGYLLPQALERLSRVSLVRPDRAKAVEQYLTQIISQGSLTHKVTEEEIVQILHSVAREQNRKNETKIIFDRRETAINEDIPNQGNSQHGDDEEEDDFFD